MERSVSRNLVDVAGDSLDGADRPADDPDQNNSGYDDREGAQSDQQPAEIMQGLIQANGVGGDGEIDLAGVDRLRGISSGVGFDGCDEGDADGSGRAGRRGERGPRKRPLCLRVGAAGCSA